MEGVWFLAMLLGGLGAIACWYWLLALAFHEDVLSGIVCFLVPPAILLLVIGRWQKARMPFLLMLGFLGVGAMGVVLGPDHLDV